MPSFQTAKDARVSAEPSKIFAGVSAAVYLILRDTRGGKTVYADCALNDAVGAQIDALTEEAMATDEVRAQIDAQEAYRIGLVNAVYPAEELMDAAEKMAKRIARNAPIAVRATKKAANDGLQTDMDAAVAIESSLFGSCFETQDQQMAMTAFVSKTKKDEFTGK